MRKSNQDFNQNLVVNTMLAESRCLIHQRGNILYHQVMLGRCVMIAACAHLYDTKTILKMFHDIMFYDYKNIFKLVKETPIAEEKYRRKIQKQSAMNRTHQEKIRNHVNNVHAKANNKLILQIIKYLRGQMQTSISSIQRVFSIGYNRSANIMQWLTNAGLVSVKNGAHPRKVYHDQIKVFLDAYGK